MLLTIALVQQMDHIVIQHYLNNLTQYHRIHHSSTTHQVCSQACVLI